MITASLLFCIAFNDASTFFGRWPFQKFVKENAFITLKRGLWGAFLEHLFVILVGFVWLFVWFSLACLCMSLFCSEILAQFVIMYNAHLCIGGGVYTGCDHGKGRQVILEPILANARVPIWIIAGRRSDKSVFLSPNKITIKNTNNKNNNRNNNNKW